MTSLELRDARPEERDQLRELTLGAYAEYASALGPLWQNYRHNIHSTLSDPVGGQQIVAERVGELLGCVLLYPAGATRQTHDGRSFTQELPEFRLLAVAPAARGQGLGSALVQECLRRARAAGDRAIVLHTTAMMDVALGMYERLGFVRVPELDFYPGGDVVVLGYRLELETEA